MPKNSKKPKNKAAARAARPKVKPALAKAKPGRMVAKRSAPARSVAKAKPKPKAKVPKANARPKAKASAKPKAKLQLRPKAKPAAKAKTRAQLKPQLKVNAKAAPKASRPRIAKAAAAPARTLILPPKPNRTSLRLVVAPAPRTPREAELSSAALEAASLPPSHSQRRVANRASDAAAPTSVPASLPAGVPANPALGMVRARAPRAMLTPDTWQRINEAAKRLGQSDLNDEQRVAVRAALEGQDSVVVLVDDERALACYQIPALLLEQPTVVLSPFAAELKAQCEALNQRRIPVVCLAPELSGPDRSEALNRVARGGALLVLASPEALREADVKQALNKAGIALFAVEEAHCASDLAHELRPSYAELGSTLRSFGSPPVMALARVASSAVRRDICERLALTAPVTVQPPAVRSNLRIVTKLPRGEARQAALVRLVGRLELPGIVFCATPHDADSVYSALRAANVASHRHHSGMTPSDRAAELLDFTLPGQRSVMVAVSAFAPGSGLPGLGEPTDSQSGFGRGAGKRDLRFVVHYQSPASIEQYVREIQRAGGDGLPATCVLLHESSHRSLHEVMLAQQRFRATHLAELGRALEAPVLEGRTVTIESLALATGQSRRTTDRLTALLADAGVVSRSGGWVRVLGSANELLEACRKLGAQLYALREQDGRRLAAVTAFAESTECRLAYLSTYLGEAVVHSCGRCDVCSTELLASQESIAPQASSRRAVVQEFSISVHAPSPLADGDVNAGGGQRIEGAPLTVKLADFGATLRGGR